MIHRRILASSAPSVTRLNTWFGSKSNYTLTEDYEMLFIVTAQASWSSNVTSGDSITANGSDLSANGSSSGGCNGGHSIYSGYSCFIVTDKSKTKSGTVLGMNSWSMGNRLAGGMAFGIKF